jgi:hypothetical protein
MIFHISSREAGGEAAARTGDDRAAAIAQGNRANFKFVIVGMGHYRSVENVDSL